MLPQCQQQDTVIIKRKQSNKINVMKIVSIEISWNRLTVWTVVCKKKKHHLHTLLVTVIEKHIWNHKQGSLLIKNDL